VTISIAGQTATWTSYPCSPIPSISVTAFPLTDVDFTMTWIGGHNVLVSCSGPNLPLLEGDIFPVDDSILAAFYGDGSDQPLTLSQLVSGVTCKMGFFTDQYGLIFPIDVTITWYGVLSLSMTIYSEAGCQTGSWIDSSTVDVGPDLCVSAPQYTAVNFSIFSIDDVGTVTGECSGGVSFEIPVVAGTRNYSIPGVGGITLSELKSPMLCYLYPFESGYYNRVVSIYWEPGYGDFCTYPKYPCTSSSVSSSSGSSSPRSSSTSSSKFVSSSASYATGFGPNDFPSSPSVTSPQVSVSSAPSTTSTHLSGEVSSTFSSSAPSSSSSSSPPASSSAAPVVSQVEVLPLLVTNPWDVLYDGVGNLYISDSSSNQVIKSTTAGTLIANFTFSPALNSPRGMAIDSDGHLYVADTNNNRVVKFAADGTQLAVFTTINPALSSPSAVALDAFNNLYIVDSYNQRIVVLSPNGTQAWVITASGLDYPAGVAVDASNAVYIADTFHNHIVKLFGPGNVIILYSDLDLPTNLVLDAQGNIFIADSANNRVVQISPTGVLLNVFTALSPPLGYPTGLTLDSAGDLYVADYYNNRVVEFTSVIPSTTVPFPTGNLCILLYSLPGTVDYPWSISYMLQFTYNPTLVAVGTGTAVTLLSGSGSRTYTNRFGASFTAPLTLKLIPSLTGPLLYLNSAIPFDGDGLTFTLTPPVQLPGGNPLLLSSQTNVYSSSGIIVEGGSALPDRLGQAFLSNVPDVINTTIGASNVNSLAANYATCRAPITFTNGLRAPTQPSSSNGGTRITYSYSISDGVTYNVTTSLDISTASAFATSADRLGNPYQTVTNITGRRVYTYLPTDQQLTSTITSITNTNAADQRFYPYTLLASAPGVYSINTAPFLDVDGLAFTVSPAVPANGMMIGSGSAYNNVTVFVNINTAMSTAVLTESVTTANPPLFSLQKQLYSIE
jgi:sugar lactone lactonase YvrE